MPGGRNSQPEKSRCSQRLFLLRSAYHLMNGEAFFIIVCPGTSTHHIPVARQRGQTIQLLTFPLQLTFHGK